MENKAQHYFRIALLCCCLTASVACSVFAQRLSIENEKLKLSWVGTDSGFRLQMVGVKSGNGRIKGLDDPIGMFRFKYAPTLANYQEGIQDDFDFLDSAYIYIRGRWKDGLIMTALDQGGGGCSVFPYGNSR